MMLRTLLVPAFLVLGGCIVTVAPPPESSHARPPVRVTRNGIMFHEKYVVPDDVPRLLEKHGYRKDKAIHILVDEDYDDQRALWVLKHNYIDRAGYTKSMFVHSRKGSSGTHHVKPMQDTVVIPYEGSRGKGGVPRRR